MAIKFQYNKTSLQDLNKQLKIRVRALPTIKNKESALRLEVKKAKKLLEVKSIQYKEREKQYSSLLGLYNEFPENMINIKDIILSHKKVAGVKTPILEDITFNIQRFNLFNAPSWLSDGLFFMQEMIKLNMEMKIIREMIVLLEYARKKTTQKVNLYEKVQIPGYENAIRKIKRFLEDEENLSKSSMKIVKSRQQKELEEAGL
ncbi:MAG: V-type ATP synthase subunit D [Hyphomicrobiales bacterium]